MDFWFNWGLIAFVILLCVVGTLLGFFRDLILSEHNCPFHKDDFYPLNKCWEKGYIMIGYYLSSAVFVLLEVGLYVYGIYYEIYSLPESRKKTVLYVCVTLIVSMLPIFLNPLLGWLRYTFWAPASKSDGYVCVIGDIKKSLNFSCMLDGLIPLGFGLFGIQILIVIICMIYNYCVKLQEKRDEEYQKSSHESHEEKLKLISAA